MERYAVIVAGGTGARMGSEIPKQFLMLHGKPVLYYSMQAFLNAFPAIQIILVLPEEYIGLGQEIVDAYFPDRHIQFTRGGRTRFHSVQNGLALVEKESIVFVHDAARCLVSTGLIKRCDEMVRENGSAVPVTESRDSVRIMIGENNEPIARNRIKMVQTPQVFHSGILLPAFAGIDYKDHFTDEATVVESFGIKIKLVPGDTDNIKLTYDADMAVAEHILRRRDTVNN